MVNLLSSMISFTGRPNMFFMSFLVIAVAVIKASIIGYFTALSAKEKGYNFTTWFVIGFFCDIPALIYIAVVAKRQKTFFVASQECPEGLL